MAELNFNALARPGPRGFYQGFEQGQEQRRAQENQLAEQQMKQQANMQAQQLTALKMQGYQEDRATKSRAEKAALFRDSILRAPDPNTAREVIKRQYADPDLGPLLQQTIPLDAALSEISDDIEQFKQYKQREAVGTAEFIKSQASERGFQDLLAKVRGGQQGAGAAPAAAPSGDMGASAQGNALAPIPASTNAMVAPVGRGRTPEQIRAEIDQFSMSNDPRAVRMVQTLTKEYEAALKPDPSELRTMQTLGYPMTQAGYASFRAAQMKDLAPPSMVAEYTFAKTPDGGNFRGSYQDFVTARAAAGRAPVPPKSEPGSKAPAGYRFTPTGDLEPIPGGPSSPGLSPKEIQKREAVRPQATSSVKSIETKSDQFISELEKLRDDPGLDQITGPIYGRTPSVSRAGSRAQALYDKIFAKGGFQALQDMREASKTGGALGNVSNEEGRRLEKSIVGGLDRTQNIADVKQGIDDLIQEILVSKSRVREAYDSTYSYGSGGNASSTKPAGGATGSWSVVR